ncbi:MAG: hypothetical protein FD143_3477 [Ignavibacteria bacterium]|nr:MAG: hypothetical protein FD143_3477 [Ignavibacteria bacterium]
MKIKELDKNSVGSPGSSYAREHNAKLYNVIYINAELDM